MDDIRKSFKMKVLHTGQYRPYGDLHYVYEIETDATAEETLEFCKREILHSRDLPEEQDFFNANRNHEMEMSEYFKGYYKFKRGQGCYIFEKVMPYTG